MQTFTVTVEMVGAYVPMRFTIFDPNERDTISVVREVDSPSNHNLAMIAQAGIEQFFNLGPGSGTLCHGWGVRYESNNENGSNLVVFEFDYDS